MQASPVLQPHEDLELVARREGPGSLDLGPAPRALYPLVVVALREGDTGDQAAVTGLFIVIHIRDSVCPIPTQVTPEKVGSAAYKPEGSIGEIVRETISASLQVLGTYLRQGAQGATSLLPLYVTEGPGESDTESAGEEAEEGQRGARCVVCQLDRVTRAALPCRWDRDSGSLICACSHNLPAVV
jgi:hypothetical protein